MRNSSTIKANINKLMKELVNAETNYFFGNTRYAPGGWTRFKAQVNANMKKLQTELYRAQARQHPARRARAATVIQTRFRAHRAKPMNNLRAQLNNLRAARDSGNRGNMVNIYNSMGSKWTSVPNGRAAASVMNNAQKIMFRAGLI